MNNGQSDYHGHRFPPEIISHAGAAPDRDHRRPQRVRGTRPPGANGVILARVWGRKRKPVRCEHSDIRSRDPALIAITL